MDVDDFIERWTQREGGAERANYQMFLSELCDVLEVPRPEPAGVERALNDYVFERAVRRRDSDEITSSLRIDLYKKGCFILEAKQSRLPGAKNAIPGQMTLLGEESEPLGRRSIARGWDVMMQNARKQAESYVFLLDASHPAPPFIITCDVGNVFEVFADFSGTGRAYSQFPDRKGFRIYLEDLRKEETRDLLAAIWTDPTSLDPARESARVTREIAKRLAEVSKALEKDHPPEDVAHFLMRCIFTMFAEDVDLLPRGKFTELLNDCVGSPGAFVPLVEELWAKMDAPREADRFFSAFRERLRYFNGNLFKNARAFPLDREEIGELLQAAKAKWTEVDPAIFGTLLEQALEPGERRKLGAHYTPRSYVQRLVEVTVMEPLRNDWQRALTKAEDAKESGDEDKAVEIVRAFHHQLCTTRVLDPACGTGNFLYVSLELMKKLEGEVLETLARLGFERLGLEGETVDPHQFLGLELNPRAAAIAELVVWIGYLQQHYRSRDGHPSEPILRAFKNINYGRHEGYDAVLTWDSYPLPVVVEKDGKRVETSEDLHKRLGAAGEELDATRKKVLADHPDLTLTGLYNVLEKLKVGEALTNKDEDVKDRGLVLILKELHETIDRLTVEAYGWSTDLSDEQILERLVALNAVRAKEESEGNVRWLRPDYQIPRFAKGAAAKTGELDLGETVAVIDKSKPVFPKDRYEQPLAVEAVLAASATPMDAAAISRNFKGGGKRIEPRVAQVLTTLARYGRVTPLPGDKYAARRVA